MTHLSNKRTPALRRWKILLAAIFVFSLGCLGVCAEPGQSAQSNRTLVIIVPGTTGNAAFWPDDITGKSTFGSELKNGLGDGAAIYPYLWDGNNDDPSRERAANSLATLIDRKSSDFDRVCLVGHSYGGDIALLAAGRCHSKIDTVVCLSTPHLYLKMKQASDGKILPIPVYCSYAAKQNTKSIVNIFPDGDSGIVALADIFPGVTEKNAIPMTQSWQEHTGFPRLAEDGQLRLLGVESQDNLQMSEFLNVANANEQFQSFVKPGPFGRDQHGAVHSRRMGFLVGQLLQDPQSKEHLDYIHSLVQPRNADQGEPVTQREQINPTTQDIADFQQIGWRLDKIKVTLAPEAKAKVPRHSTLFLHMIEGWVDASQDIQMRWLMNPEGSATWDNTKFILNNGRTERLIVSTSPILATGTSLGEHLVNAMAPPPASLPADAAHRIYWSIDFTWESVHY